MPSSLLTAEVIDFIVRLPSPDERRAIWQGLFAAVHAECDRYKLVATCAAEFAHTATHFGPHNALAEGKALLRALESVGLAVEVP